MDVANYTVHKSFNKPQNAYDIAILQLAKEVDLTTYTPACMAKTSDTTTFDGKNAWVYGEMAITVCSLMITMSDQGWGSTSPDGDSSNVLNEVEVPVVSNDECRSAMAYIEDYYVVYDYDMEDLITDGMLCAGGVEGKDNCYVSAASFLVS